MAKAKKVVSIKTERHPATKWEIDGKREGRLGHLRVETARAWIRIDYEELEFLLLALKIADIELPNLERPKTPEQKERIKQLRTRFQSIKAGASIMRNEMGQLVCRSEHGPFRM